MKTLIFALVIFCVIIGIMTWNFLYLHNIMDMLAQLASNIPETPLTDDSAYTSAFTTLHQTWLDSKFTICLTVGHKEADQIDTLIVELSSARIAGDTFAYIKARALLIDAFQKIAEDESFSAEGIL